jgi:predicted MFS family arabinose efflux permease
MKRYLRATFESLHNRNYRLFFTGQATSITGSWMQKVAQAWLVLELTDSGTLLGVTAALQHLPTLLMGPWGGLLADRLDKRRILLWTQSAAAVPALLLGVLTATGVVTWWIVLVLALSLGLIEALDKPARHSFVIEMVGPQHITNAVALNTITLNAGKVVGPAVAGILISTVGLASTFLLNAVSYLAVVLALLAMRTDQLFPVVRATRAAGQLREGLRYVRGEPGLLGPIVLMAVSGLLAYEWMVTIPLFARNTFDGDATVVGLMFTAMGAGAVVGGLAVAGSLRATTNQLVATGLVFSVMVVGTAAAPGLAAAFAVLILLGAASVAFRAVGTALIQLNADPAMRGRAMSLMIVAVAGTTPIGAPLVGWIGETFGPRIALGLGGVATALAAVGMWVYLRRHGISARVAIEDQRLDRDRNGARREPEPPEVDVVEVPEAQSVQRHQVPAETKLVPKDRAEA